MQPVQLSPDIYWVGVNDRHTEKFENLWSIRETGISYNSYLVKDSKNVLIDLASKMSLDALFDQIRTMIDPSDLHYLVINHIEPDHSGALKALIQTAPQVKLLGSARTLDMLASFYGITENVQAVADGEELNLGSHTLKFISTPNVHWPETMMTYETTGKILFPCDGFGGYGALNGAIFDDDTVDLPWYEGQALRYFVNIIAHFAKPVNNALAKLAGIPLEMVAPSHGLVWRKNPQRIIELYRKWASYAGRPGDPAVTLLFGSMYGNTERLMEIVAQGIAAEALTLNIFDVTKADISEILVPLWLNAGVMVGAPTYEGGLFLDMTNVLQMAQRKHIFNKITAGFGSAAWGGGGQRELNERAVALKWEVFGNLEFKGEPKSSELDEGFKFGAEFARKVREGAG
jgi:anaerobic nitric oxide reductase flavorubredoxin